MKANTPTAAEVARAVLRDIGCSHMAARYCERVAAQNGQDAATYTAAAQMLRIPPSPLVVGPL